MTLPAVLVLGEWLLLQLISAFNVLRVVGDETAHVAYFAHLGGKGAGLAEMTNAKLPVPPGFTITTEACNAYFAAGKKVPPGLWDQVERALAVVERATKKKLGDAKNPLLVSVRSGAAMSMPGMMDTVLNLGLNDESRAGLAKLTKNERFAWDAYRRFISMFG